MRIETIHPMLVHFPLALLLVGTVLRGASFYFPRLLLTARIVLTIGVCFAWIAILAGELAANIVAPDLCDPSVLDKHSLLAYTGAYLFTSGVLLDWVKAIWAKGLMHKFLTVLCSILFFLAFIDLLVVGALGGSMVYDQGAAVIRCCKGEKSQN